MEEYQLRVVIEKAELDIKIQRWGSFFLSDRSLSVDLVEIARMRAQIDVMKDYSNILQDRIANFLRKEGMTYSETGL